MKADDVMSMEDNDAEMEYINLPSPGIYSNMQAEQIANYSGSNEYQCQESSCVQNHVNNSNCHFGYCNYSASPNSCSCCCGYDSKDNNNIQSTAQNTQNYGQVEHQYEYDDQSNIGQYCNMNRCAGGMENYAVNSSSPAVAYQSINGYNNIDNFFCNIEQQTQSNCFTMPSLGNLDMNHTNPDYWSCGQDTEDHPDDAIQSQTVYSSDFQPIHGEGNKFNHFPNNHFMDLKVFQNLINSSRCQSEPPEYSYQLGDPTYDMDDNQDNQMQVYPMSNAMQMCNS
ncbi:hypothetical protein ACLKA6_002741 [Drosophila palustris]